MPATSSADDTAPPEKEIGTTKPIQEVHDDKDTGGKSTETSIRPSETNPVALPASSSVDDRSPSDVVDPVARAEEFAQGFRSMIFSSWQVAMIASLILIRIRRKEPLPSHEEVKTLVRIGALGMIPATGTGASQEYHEKLSEILNSVERKDILHRG
jgi:hypothetical protein